MLDPTMLHSHQKDIIKTQLTHKQSMLWVGTGCGKTIGTLSSISHLIATGAVKKVLVVAPIRVLYSVWDNIESKKWTHTQHLKAQIIHGTVKNRIQALTNNDCDIYGVNYEGLTWLTEQLQKLYIDRGKTFPFDMVVYDEITKMKNTTSIRWKGDVKEVIDKNGDTLYDCNGKPIVKKSLGWNRIAPLFKYRTGLTGTPSPNGEIDLFGQFLCIDDGKRLGKYITNFRNSFFRSDYMGYEYKITNAGHIDLQNRIKDITLSVRTSDCLDLPDVIVNDIMVTLPKKARLNYLEVEKELFTQLESGTDVELTSETSVYNKCLQICNGNIYTHNATENEPVSWEKLHDAKLDALESIMEEAGGNPVFVAYSYKMDADRILKRFKKYNPVNLTGEKSSNIMGIIDKWGEGDIRLMIAHPMSASHGIDGLQKSGSIVVWFGMNYSLELYLQFNGRIDRQGQTEKVTIHRILCEDTIDVVVRNVIERKDTSQTSLLSAMSDFKRLKR